MNYCYGNCVLCVEGDDNIYSVKPYYKGVAKPWREGVKGFWAEFKRFINI